MRLRKVLAVFRKEVLDSLRDRRTLMMMVLLPIVLYPAMFILMTQLTSAGLARLQQEPSRVSVRGALPGALDSLLSGDTSLVYCPSPDPAADLAGRNIGPGSTGGGWPTPPSSTTTAPRRNRASPCPASGTWRNATGPFCCAGAWPGPGSTPPSSSLRPADREHRPPSRMGGMVLGIMLPILLIVCMMMAPCTRPWT